MELISIIYECPEDEQITDILSYMYIINKNINSISDNLIILDKNKIYKASTKLYNASR